MDGLTFAESHRLDGLGTSIALEDFNALDVLWEDLVDEVIGVKESGLKHLGRRDWGRK